jgi:hypothetical protein
MKPVRKRIWRSFFVRLKNAAVDAYVLSDVGMREYLGYKGDAMLVEFPGCRDHPI